MSNFTTQLRFICETAAGLNESAGYNSVNNIIEDAREGIFNFSYPIFDEAYRPILEKKILKHYYTREICAETVGRWKLFLDMKMNEIMPYYNKLYQSELLQFNPLYDVDYTKEGSKDIEGGDEGTINTTGDNTDRMTGTVSEAVTGTIADQGTNGNTRTNNLTSRSADSGSDTDSTTSANKNDRWDYFSDTPQGAITDLNNLTYMTNARHITDDGTGSTASGTKTYGKVNTTNDTGTVQDSGTNSNTRTYNTNNQTTYNTTNTGTMSRDIEKSNTMNSTEEYLERIYGKTPGRTYSELLKQYRDTFLNIDMMVINSLSDLFFGLYE